MCPEYGVISTMFVALLLLSHFSRVRLCATPSTAVRQAPSSLGFSRQEHWSGLPFPSPMRESEKWKWSRSVVSDPQRPHGLQPTRLLHPWDFPGKSTGVGCHCLLRIAVLEVYNDWQKYVGLHCWFLLLEQILVSLQAFLNNWNSVIHAGLSKR